MKPYAGKAKAFQNVDALVYQKKNKGRMNGGIMLDTNVIIYSLGGNASVTKEINNQEHFVSGITEIELLGFHGLTVADEKIINDYLTLAS